MFDPSLYDKVYDQEFDDLCERRGPLVDAKFLRGLSDDETAELAAIDARLDEKEKPWTDALMADLRSRLEQQARPQPPQEQDAR